MGAKPKPQAPTLSLPELIRHMQRYRAVEAAIWGMPAVNFELMRQAAVKAGAGDNEIVYWSKLLNWKNQTLTPNPDTIYLMPIYNTAGGPVVMEIPPAVAGEGNLTGSIDSVWQTAIEDVGPAGADKGAGGKYLLLPPGFKGAPPPGYIPRASETNRGFVILRSNLKSGSDEDVTKAVAYGKRVKLYPLDQAANPPPTKYVDAFDVMFDANIPYDIRFFEALHDIVQDEPWLTRDKAMIDPLKSIGIEKGKPFRPDAETKALLEEAIGGARDYLDTIYEGVFATPFAEGAGWTMPASHEAVQGMQTGFANPDSYPVDERGSMYTMAYFSAKRLGTGQFYLMAIKDKDGDALEGGKTYRLHVPPKAPVKLYWSVTAYDRETHGLIRNMARASRSSQNPDIKANADGSVDVFFGPKAPKGQESNWVPTDAKRDFELLFRLYGPEKPFFDKQWKLPDVEKVK